ncbi:MAG: hypothetical protein WBM50_25985 [Acidimicrobiales bacterium]
MITDPLPGVASAIALSGTDHLDAYASERLARVIDSSNIYGLPGPVAAPEPGTARSVAPQAVLPPDLEHKDLDRLLGEGHRLRLVPGHSPRPNWFTIGRIDEDGNVSFDTDPGRASDNDELVQFGKTTNLPSGSRLDGNHRDRPPADVPPVEPTIGGIT